MSVRGVGCCVEGQLRESACLKPHLATVQRASSAGALNGPFGAAADGGVRYGARLVRSESARAEPPDCHLMPCPRGAIGDLRHARCFTAHVEWNCLTLGRGQGASKQQAESAAAIDALRRELWVSGTADPAGPADPAPTP